MTILLADPRVARMPLHETHEPLVTLGASFGPARARVRAGLASRLRRAQLALPVGVSLRVVEGHRSLAEQRAILADYSARVRAEHPGISNDELVARPSRVVAPLDVAPHVPARRCRAHRSSSGPATAPASRR